MNSKLLFAATLAVALLGSGAAMASEATQFDNGPGRLTRAEVKAELKRAQAAGELNGVSELYGSFQPGATTSVRSRAEVRAEAVRAVHEHSVSKLYLGA